MSDEQDNTAERLEALLRQWGADEAGRVAKERLQATQPTRRPWQGTVLRWVPVAAAAVLLLAAGTLFALLWHFRGPDSRQRGELARAATGPTTATSMPSVAALQAQIREVITENEKLKAERDELKTARIEADGKWVTALKTHREEMAALREQSEEEIGRLKTSLAAAKDEFAKTDLALKAMAKDLAVATAARDKALADLNVSARAAEQLKTKVADLTRRQGEIEKEYAAATKALAEANEKLGRDLLAARRRNEQMRAEFRRVYLSAGAPGQTGLAAHKTTARRMRLLERGAALRKQCADEDIKAVLDRIDVALTRLDMLDVNDAAAVRRFARAVQAAALTTRIDELLALGPTQPGLKAYLREARMILAGADDVG